MSVESKWREHHLKRRRLMMVGWGLSLLALAGVLSFMALGAEM